MTRLIRYLPPPMRRVACFVHLRASRQIDGLLIELRGTHDAVILVVGIGPAEQVGGLLAGTGSLLSLTS